MIESPYWREIRDEGRNEEREYGQKTMQGALLDALEIRFNQKPPADIASAVQAEPSLEQLARWHRQALTCATHDDFRKAIGLTNGSTSTIPPTP